MQRKYHPSDEDTYEEIDDGCEENNSKVSILDVRDRLNRLNNLLSIVIEALTESRLNDIKIMAGDALYFYIKPEIEKIEEELKNL